MLETVGPPRRATGDRLAADPRRFLGGARLAGGTFYAPRCRAALSELWLFLVQGVESAEPRSFRAATAPQRCVRLAVLCARGRCYQRFFAVACRARSQSRCLCQAPPRSRSMMVRPVESRVILLWETSSRPITRPRQIRRHLARIHQGKNTLDKKHGRVQARA